MKVAIVITEFVSFNTFLSELAAKLAINGVEVHVISSGKRSIGQADKFDYENLGIALHTVDFPRSYNIYKQFNASLKIHKILDSIRPDIVHIHFTTSMFTTLFARRTKYFTLGTFHGLGFPVLDGIKRRIFKAVEIMCFNRLDRIYLLNKFDYEIVAKIKPGKAFIYKSLGLGCDLDKFDTNRFTLKDKSLIRKTLNIDETDFVIAYTGRFVDFKGFNLTVKAFLSIYKTNKNVKLVLMGVKDEIHPTGLTPQEEAEMDNCDGIVMIGFTNEIEKYLAIANLFLFPSVKEGIPICITEALAMRVPVVTSDSRGCNDLVKDNFNGLLVSNPPTVDEIIHKVEKLLLDPALLAKIADNIIINRARYGRENYLNEQFDIYKELFKHNGSN